MPAIRAMCIVRSLWPLEATPPARAMGHLLRGLASAADLVVLAPRPPSLRAEELGHLGLASRLSPLVIEGVEHGLHEGRLPGGRGDLVLVDGAGGGETLARVALRLGELARPDALLAADDAAEVLSWARAKRGPLGRARTVLLLDDDARGPGLARAIHAADAIAIPSRSVVADLVATAPTEVAAALATASDRIGMIGRGVDRGEGAATPPLIRPATVLRRRVGLPPIAMAPLVVVPPPFSLLGERAWAELPRTGAQLVFLDRTARALALAERHPARCVAVSGAGDELHGADLVLFAAPPPRRAPSPLGPMTSGVVPIAPHIGAFADAIVDCDGASRTGAGFLFSPHRADDDVGPTVRRAVHMFGDADGFAALRDRARLLDLGFRSVATRLLELLRDPRGEN